jgi:alpha-galactosidase
MTCAFDAQHPAFSFRLDGQPFAAADWQAAAAPDGTCTYRHPSGLRVTATYLRFRGSAAVEVMLRLTHEGDTPSPLISDLLPVDLTWPLAADAAACLHHARGSLCQMDDFQPLRTNLPVGADLRLEPNGGRSSNGVAPFMNLQTPAGGLTIAVGWSGQWAAHFTRQEAQLRVTAGMARTNFRLQPGESVRTPRVLLIPWEGDDPTVGTNLLRRLILEHYSPLDPDGRPCLPPLSHNTMMTYYTQGTTNEREMRQMLRRCAELGLEAFWIDACWYGTVGNSDRPEDSWWANAGNWFYNRQNFPHGLGDIGEAVSHESMDFVVWFEPERVHERSMIGREHPEYVLRVPASEMGLFNLGDPPAREYLTGLISGFIADANITIYRQDFNMDPLPYWQVADAADRQGIAEMLYVEGLYHMWDELRGHHPGLRIDNCSSGGRRIDLETVRRSYPLWRSDFSDAGGPSHGVGLAIADQVITSSLSVWVPLHGGAVWSVQPYPWRSAMSTGVSLYGDIAGEAYPLPLTRQALAELRRLRPLLLADFYNLTPVTTAYHDWTGYQFHDPRSGAGCALFFRRPESQFPTLEASLQGLDPAARYRVSRYETYDLAGETELTGAELAALTVTLPAGPSCVLLEYRRV